MFRSLIHLALIFEYGIKYWSRINSLISAKKSAKILIGIMLTLGQFEKYIVDPWKTGLNCMDPFMCRFFFFLHKYGTTFLIHGWLYPWVQNLHGLQYLQIWVSIAGPGTSVPHIPRDGYSCISHVKFSNPWALDSFNLFISPISFSKAL